MQWNTVTYRLRIKYIPMTTVVLHASITVRRISYTVKRAINNYTGPLFYLTTIVRHRRARGTLDEWATLVC